MKQYTLKLDEIDTLSNEIIDSIKNGVVILRGDLAAGKTTLVKSIVKVMKLDDEVTSPTFSLQQCYSDKVYHYDIYNHGIEHFLSLGLLEELEKDGIHLVEWGDEILEKILRDAGIELLIVDIQKDSDATRTYRITNA